MKVERSKWAIAGIYCILYDYCIEQSKDQPGNVANLTRGQLNRENGYFSVPVRA